MQSIDLICETQVDLMKSLKMEAVTKLRINAWYFSTYNPGLMEAFQQFLDKVKNTLKCLEVHLDYGAVKKVYNLPKMPELKELGT